MLTFITNGAGTGSNSHKKRLFISLSLAALASKIVSILGAKYRDLSPLVTAVELR